MKSFVLFFIGTIVFSIQGLAQADVQKKLQKQLILAEAGAVIEIPEGVFEFTNTLSLEEKKKITIGNKIDLLGQAYHQNRLKYRLLENHYNSLIPLKHNKVDLIW